MPVDDFLSEALKRFQPGGGIDDIPFYGKRKGAPLVFDPPEVDVAGIRNALRMTQREFAERFGLKAWTVRAWERGRRRPCVTARALLLCVQHERAAVERALYGPRSESE